MHGLFPQSLMFSYSIITWLFICLLILKLLIDFFFGVCFVLFVFLFLLNFSFELFLFWLCLFFFYPCLVFVFPFFRHLSFHQRCPSTSVSNSIESFCVPWSWTANFSRRSKRHRTHGERLLRSFHLINQIFLPKQKKNKKQKKNIFPFAGCLYRSSSSDAVFPDGCLLLDAGRGNLPLPVCCESLQHQHQDAHVSRHLMGYFHDLFYYNMYWR